MLLKAPDELTQVVHNDVVYLGGKVAEVSEEDIEFLVQTFGFSVPESKKEAKAK